MLLACDWVVVEVILYVVIVFFFKQKTAYEIVSRDWSSDVCSSDLAFYTAHFLLRQRPAFYTAHFSLRQRPLFLYCQFLVAAAPLLFILTNSWCGSAPSF